MRSRSSANVRIGYGEVMNYVHGLLFDPCNGLL